MSALGAMALLSGIGPMLVSPANAQEEEPPVYTETIRGAEHATWILQPILRLQSADGNATLDDAIEVEVSTESSTLSTRVVEVEDRNKDNPVEIHVYFRMIEEHGTAGSAHASIPISISFLRTFLDNFMGMVHMKMSLYFEGGTTDLTALYNANNATMIDAISLRSFRDPPGTRQLLHPTKNIVNGQPWTSVHGTSAPVVEIDANTNTIYVSVGWVPPLANNVPRGMWCRTADQTDGRSCEIYVGKIPVTLSDHIAKGETLEVSVAGRRMEFAQSAYEFFLINSRINRKFLWSWPLVLKRVDDRTLPVELSGGPTAPVDEPASGSTDITFTVRVADVDESTDEDGNADATLTLTYDIAAAEGVAAPATGDADFTLVENGTVTLTAENDDNTEFTGLTGTIQVSILPDDISEVEETFTVSISAADNPGAMATSDGLLLALNFDNASSTIAIAKNDRLFVSLQGVRTRKNP